MKDLPNAFWAFLFIFLACALAVTAMLVPNRQDVGAVITMASSIITGAFGYIQGHIQGTKDAQQNPTMPVAPAPKEQ